MNLLRLPDGRSADQTALYREGRLRVLRSALVAPAYLAAALGLEGIEYRLSQLLTEVDRLLEECDQ